MNLQDYQKAAERTMLPTQPAHEQMQNAALGLCGEAVEFADVARSSWGNPAPVVDEAGDLLWYVAQMCKANGTSIANIPPRPFEHDDLELALMVIWSNTGFIADLIKKHVYHKKPIVMSLLMPALRVVVSAVATVLAHYGRSLEAACIRNDRKLRARFPDGFSHAAANARADEREVLPPC